MQNKCIHFCLKRDKIHYISEEDFKIKKNQLIGGLLIKRYSKA